MNNKLSKFYQNLFSCYRIMDKPIIYNNTFSYFKFSSFKFCNLNVPNELLFWVLNILIELYFYKKWIKTNFPLNFPKPHSNQACINFSLIFRHIYSHSFAICDTRWMNIYLPTRLRLTIEWILLMWQCSVAIPRWSVISCHLSAQKLTKRKLLK